MKSGSFLLDKKLSSVCYYKSGQNLFQIKVVIIITYQNIGAELLPVVIARISEQNYCQNYCQNYLLQIGIVISNRGRFITNRCTHQCEISLKMKTMKI